MISKKELKELKNKLNKLEKKDIDLIISDFDDTIFSRTEQLEDSELLKNNRWSKWNDVILKEIWKNKYFETYYDNKKFPQSISSKLRENHDLILTAWYEELQTAKLKSCKLNHINYHVVENAEDKIIETIKYIANRLKFLPSKITVYEDRPKYFIEYKNFLEEFLGIEIHIMYVEMIDNHNEPKITKID